MDVMTTARSMGLTSDTGDVFGTIEESAVIEHLLALGSAHPGHGELFAEAVARVQRSRSAGLERVTADSMFARDRANLEIQLRYRAEMAAVFEDLAIDLAIEQAAAAMPAPTA